MWANLKIKIKDAIEKIKGIKRPTVSKPDFPGLFSKVKVTTGSFFTSFEPRHLVYFALILLPAIVGLGTYYGIMDSKSKLEAANLPENRLFRMGVSFTADDFVKYAGRGEKGVTTLFMQAGMAPDSYRKTDGFTPLHAAAAYGQTPIVRQLLDQGADVNARDKAGQTALMMAVCNSHADVVNVLLQRGADITARDSKGNTSISMAKAKNDRRVLEALVQAGVIELKEALDKVAPVSKKPDKSLTTPDSKPQGAKSSGSTTESKTVAAATAPPGEFILAPGYAGNIGVGKSIDSLRIVTAIHVFDSRYKTGNVVRVGGTLGELRQAGGLKAIEYGDALYAITRDGRIRYELDISADSIPIAWLNGGGEGTLPDDMKIKSIYIF
ncbi:MAG: Ankyrin repeat (many copies) [Firmicutes bacterium]|nr:Ankyrin repeat (many copies) [Bacillota bacterium]